MSLEPIHPESWSPARGYTNGMLAPAGARMLFVAGQVAWSAGQELVGSGDFATQFGQALANVAEVVRAAGGEPSDIARLTIYVTDKRLYLDSLADVGKRYREVMGSHYPAMALLEVAGLIEEGALVEIEATAALPGPPGPG